MPQSINNKANNNTSNKNTITSELFSSFTLSSSLPSNSTFVPFAHIPALTAAERAKKCYIGSDDFPIVPLPPKCPSAQPSREEKEKRQLKERKEGFIRYDAKEIDKPFQTQPDTAAFLPDSERYSSDSAGEELFHRHQNYERYNKLIQSKRLASFHREQQRYQLMNQAEAAAAARLAMLQQHPTKNKKNSSSVPMNLLTSEYARTPSGLSLQHADQIVRYRGAVRSYTLDLKGNGEFNPITGVLRDVGTKPIRPPTPKFENGTNQERTAVH